MPVPEELLQKLKHRPPARAAGIGALRATMEQMTQCYARAPAMPDGLRQDITLGTPWKTAARIYHPAGQGPFPMLVYFHGGGWVRGNLAMSDGVCARLAHRATCLVVNVAYSLAPEHKFPAALEECYEAVGWLRAQAASLQGEPAKLAVGGDSSGANLAAAVCLLLRERGAAPPVCQVLFNPVLDLTADYRRQGTFADPFLTVEDMEFYRECYLEEAEAAASPHASPLLAASLAGLPPAFIATVAGDPLRRDGEAYAARLRQAGVAVESHCYDGVMHGFISFVLVWAEAAAAAEEAAQYLRGRFGL